MVLWVKDGRVDANEFSGTSPCLRQVLKESVCTDLWVNRF
jgi:hypothetical protein